MTTAALEAPGILCSHEWEHLRINELFFGLMLDVRWAYDWLIGTLESNYERGLLLLGLKGVEESSFPSIRPQNVSPASSGKTLFPCPEARICDGEVTIMYSINIQGMRHLLLSLLSCA